MQDDFYGDKFKHFIGVVKDISDPLGANRVRVRIKGIHPEDPLGDGGGQDGSPTGTGTTPSTSGGSTGGATTGGSVSTPANTNSSTTPSTPLQAKAALPALSNLPTNRELTGKISKFYTLGDLTTGTTVTGRNCFAHMNELTPTIIQNLSNIAVNILDPLKQDVHVIITSGWRPVGTSAHTTNHGQGYAVDICASGMSVDNLYYYIINHLKGRYSFCYNEESHVHIQYQSTPGHSQGTLSSPLNMIK